MRRYISFLSLKKLSSMSVGDIVSSIADRCKLQLRVLQCFPLTNRHVKILLSLYSDTVLTAETVPSIGVYSKREHLLSTYMSLESRHSMVNETIINFCKTLGHHDGSQGSIKHNLENITCMLRIQTSLSACFQHAVENMSKGSGCVKVFNIYDVCNESIVQARALAEHAYNFSPDIILRNSDARLCVMSIPSFYVFILVEIFKNAIRATVDEYCIQNGVSAQELTNQYVRNDMDLITAHIECFVQETSDHVVVSIIDKGVGMTEETIQNCTKFLWATGLNPQDMVLLNASYQPMTAPLHGLGVGLSLSAMYATHFGGKIVLSSGGVRRGTTVKLFIPKNADIDEILESTPT